LLRDPKTTLLYTLEYHHTEALIQGQIEQELKQAKLEEGLRNQHN